VAADALPPASGDVNVVRPISRDEPVLSTGLNIRFE
jgi:hypothetical protein